MSITIKRHVRKSKAQSSTERPSEIGTLSGATPEPSDNGSATDQPSDVAQTCGSAIVTPLNVAELECDIDRSDGDVDGSAENAFDNVAHVGATVTPSDDAARSLESESARSAVQQDHNSEKSDGYLALDREIGSRRDPVPSVNAAVPDLEIKSRLDGVSDDGTCAESPREIERRIGARTIETNDNAAVIPGEIDVESGSIDHGSEKSVHAYEVDCSGSFSRYRDLTTANLGALASTWLSLHKQYQATILRAKYGAPALQSILLTAAKETKAIREMLGKELTKATRAHVLHPWLKTARSATAVHVVRMIAVIGDPLRFPGRRCAAGHHLPSDWPTDICLVPVGDKGTKREDMQQCNAAVGSVRRGTGVRSLWHYLGLHVVDGRSPQKRKGVQATWSPVGRSCVLQPDGIADQIVRHNKEPWRGIYDAAKARLKVERGVSVGATEIEIEGGDSALASAIGSSGGVSEGSCEIEPEIGDSTPLPQMSDADNLVEADPPIGVAQNSSTDRASEIARQISVARMDGEPDDRVEIEPASGALRPFQIDRLARKIAVKAFVGDLLVEWKRLVQGQ